MFTDTHAHIYKDYYDIKKIMLKISNSETNRIITNGVDIKTNKEIIKLIKKYDNLYGAIGIHPENVEKYSKNDIEFIKKKYKKIIAIGEIGLDYHYCKENKEKQKELFEIQLQVAQSLNLPVIIHMREATEDTLSILKKYKVKGVIHSFSGSIETANILLKMGYYFGINGVITFKNSNIKEVYKKIPINRILLETDSPYLTPEPKRGAKNDPSNIIYIAEYVANIYNINTKKLAEITNKNIEVLFDI